MPAHRGEFNHNAKLTDTQAEQIKSIHKIWKHLKLNLGYKTLAKHFKVAPSTVARIIRNEIRNKREEF